VCRRFPVRRAAAASLPYSVRRVVLQSAGMRVWCSMLPYSVRRVVLQGAGMRYLINIYIDTDSLRNRQAALLLLLSLRGAVARAAGEV
jgi:hypothetical protein